jgi:hypothetical protein
MTVVKDIMVPITVIVKIITIVVVANIVTLTVKPVTVPPKLNVSSVLKDTSLNQIVINIVWELVHLDIGQIHKPENVNLVTTLVKPVLVLTMMDIVKLVKITTVSSKVYVIKKLQLRCSITTDHVNLVISLVLLVTEDYSTNVLAVQMELI